MYQEDPGVQTKKDINLKEISPNEFVAYAVDKLITHFNEDAEEAEEGDPILRQRLEKIPLDNWKRRPDLEEIDINTVLYLERITPLDDHEINESLQVNSENDIHYEKNEHSNEKSPEDEIDYPEAVLRDLEALSDDLYVEVGNKVYHYKPKLIPGKINQSKT